MSCSAQLQKRFRSCFSWVTHWIPDFLNHALPSRLRQRKSPTLHHRTSLHGRVSVIHISSVFYLFSEEQQLDLARSLAGLLAPLPGSIILGSHNGGLSKGVGRRSNPSGVGRPFTFLHSPESWRELWEGVFPRGTIKVEAELEESTWADGQDRGWLTWSVSRI